MIRMEPARARVAAMAACACLLTTPCPAIAQTDQAHSVASRAVAPGASQGLAALNAAARDGKYSFVFFWKANDEQSRTMYGVFQSAMRKWQGSSVP